MPALERNLDHAIEHDRWMVDPRHPDCLAPEDRWCRVCGRLDSEHCTVHSEKNGTAWAGPDPILAPGRRMTRATSVALSRARAGAEMIGGWGTPMA